MQSVDNSVPVRVEITVKNPKEIAFSVPVGTVEVRGIKAAALKFVLSGAGQVKLTGIQVALSGWGNFNSADLQAKRATVDLSGAGDVIVRVERALAATIKGAGSVKYFGNPRVTQTVTGAGSIKRAD